MTQPVICPLCEGQAAHLVPRTVGALPDVVDCWLCEGRGMLAALWPASPAAATRRPA